MRVLAIVLSSMVFASSGSISLAASNSVEDDIKTVLAVAPGGVGSKDARMARDRLAKGGVKQLPRLLDAMDTDNPVAANWFRTAFEQIVRREEAKPQPQLPIAFFKSYARDPKRQGKVRRLLLDLLDRSDPGFRSKLILALLNDPEFRGDAVTATLKRGDAAKKKGDIEQAKSLFRAAFGSARDSSQVIAAAGKLKAVGEEVNIISHMGFVIDWHLLGPFNAPGKTGFELSFPPEDLINLNAKYRGKAGDQIRWERYQTADRLGQVNLATAIAPVKEAVGYAYSEINSPRDQKVELRCGADDNISVWLNGKKVFSRLQWLNGIRLDRFSAPVTLKKGRNTLLLKICQGPQHKNPAVPNNWSMQLRFCDANGAGVGITNALK
ncbi:MAG: hypothetical protein HOK71_01550 [Planctomycetaceae bacterium]|jgi:hypothetical protein|nr:hypothetical protein [Planctomycetaceae bacterium]MBT6483342.1 hypothetical protein [Planctomycetaceae bacterium]